jgi:two-component system, response regulator
MSKLLSSTLLLIVEDSLDDFKAMQRAFSKSGWTNPIVHCQFGEDALNYLYGRGSFVQREHLPVLILLDLNLPGINGFDVLTQVKQDPNLCQIPIVVMTTSNDQHDVTRCYQAGANTYIRKPTTSQGLVRTVEDMKHYWFETALLPDSKGIYGGNR